MNTRELKGATVAFCVLAAMAVAPAAAANFYQGKTITIVCPYPPGGTYDRMARLAAQFLPNHIPGQPSAIVQNQPGGGGVIGIRAVYRADPDGLSISHFAGTVVVRRLAGDIKDIDFEKVGWLGSAGGAHYVMMMRSNRTERTIEELKKAATPIRIGSSGPASLLTQAAKMLERAGKLNVRLVSGYTGYNPMALAMKQNEIDAVATAVATIQANAVTSSMYRDGTIRMVLSMGGAPAHPDLAAEVAKLPNFIDAIEDPQDRQAYEAFSGLLSATRPFMTTPGVPAERLAVLRKAFVDMMGDPAFKKASVDQGFVLNPLDGAAAERLILSVFKLPSAVQTRLNGLLK